MGCGNWPPKAAKRGRRINRRPLFLSAAKLFSSRITFMSNPVRAQPILFPSLPKTINMSQNHRCAKKQHCAAYCHISLCEDSSCDVHRQVVNCPDQRQDGKAHQPSKISHGPASFHCFADFSIIPPVPSFKGDERFFSIPFSLFPFPAVLSGLEFPPFANFRLTKYFYRKTINNN